VVNEALAKRIAHQLKTGHRTFVVPQFCEGPSIKRDYSIGSPAVLLTVANFRFSEKAEGVIWLIEKVDRFVRESGVAVCLQVAGSGLHLKDVKAFLESHETADLLTVELLGFVTDLDSYYRGADVLLYRSFHDATPNVILESKRYGLPLLANDCEEFRSLVKHGESGLLYRDECTFAANLRQVLAQQALRENLGHNAISEHEMYFSLQAAQVKMAAVLIEILGAAGRRPNFRNE